MTVSAGATCGSPPGDILSQAIRRARKRGTYHSDVEMESVRLHHGRSDAYYPEGRDFDDSGQDELRRSLVAATERFKLVD